MAEPVRITTREAIALSRLSRATFWRRIAQGRLPGPVDRGLVGLRGRLLGRHGHRDEQRRGCNGQRAFHSGSFYWLQKNGVRGAWTAHAMNETR